MKTYGGIGSKNKYNHGYVVWLGVWWEVKSTRQITHEWEAGSGIKTFYWVFSSWEVGVRLK